MEHRDDLEQLLLDGLPSVEREHVRQVIRQGDVEKLRRKRGEVDEPESSGYDDQ